MPSTQSLAKERPRMPSRLNGGVTLVAALLLASPLLGQHAHPKLKSKERTLRSFVVLPPRIEPGGQQDGSVASQASQVASRLGSAVAAALKASGLEVMPAPTDASVAAVQASYDTLHASIQARPTDVAKGNFTLGDQAQKLAGADALVFVRGRGSFSQTTKAFTDAGSFGFTQTPRNDVKAWVAFVDARTGDVLYLFEAKGKGNHLETSQAFEKSVGDALKRLPR